MGLWEERADGFDFQEIENLNLAHRTLQDVQINHVLYTYLCYLGSVVAIGLGNTTWQLEA